MNRQTILEQIALKEQEIKDMPYTSLFDDEGECDEEAYQERLEQGWRKDEIYMEIDQLNEELKELERDNWKEYEENEVYEISMA